MLGITPGTFRNNSVTVWRESPQCCCTGCISVFGWWQTCPAHTKAMCKPSASPAQGLMVQGHVQTPTLDQGRRKTEGWSVLCGWAVLLMLLQPSSCRGSLGCSECPALRGAFARLQNTRKGHPVPLLKWRFQRSQGSRNVPQPLIPPGSLGGAQTSQLYKMLTGNSRDSWYPSSAIAQFLNKFYYCRNKAELDHSIFLKDKHHNPNHVCICWKYKSCVGNRTLGSLELTGLNSGYLQLLLWFCFVSICSWRFWRMNCLHHSRLSHADLMANISKENITKQRPRLSHPGTSWLSGSCSTQLSSLCTYIFMYLYLYVLISLCIYNFMYLYLYVFISSFWVFL